MLIAVGIMFVSLGAYVLLYWRRQLLKQLQARNWPVVEGKVIESQVIAGNNMDMDTLKFIYVYEFADSKRTSSTIDLFDAESNDGIKKAVSLKYPVGANVKVYCEPITGNGLLDVYATLGATQTRGMGIFLMIVGISFISIGLYL